jgi:uncharacterized protein YlzI (FlbEa/FlbD family)
MNKFIVITDMRDPVGVEELVGRLTILNVDHIQSVEMVEDHIAEHLNYKSVITMFSGRTHFPIETQEQIVEKIYAE